MPSFSARRTRPGSGRPAPPHPLASSSASTISGASSSKGTRRARVKSRISIAAAVNPLQQAANRLQVEAVGLHLAGERDASDMLLPVVAGAAANFRGWEKALGLVRADVSHSHPGAASEFADRHLRVRRPGLLHLARLSHLLMVRATAGTSPFLSCRDGRRLNAFEHDPAVAVASHVKAVIVLQARLDARSLWKRHASLLVDDRLADASRRTLELRRLEAGPRSEWGRQDSNLRRQSRTIYSRHPLTAWILPRCRLRFYK